ncbi:glycosyltransferase family 2 protein [Clostridium sp.]|uniref:glycosyltransferase family 2 protein n=1 Tax=Clostridium sp. TaxID=1506 RepID=UPI003F3D22A4
MKKVLIGSPIHQKQDVLREFLISLEELVKPNIQVDYCFVDDNSDTGSSKMLVDFKKNHDNVKIIAYDDDENEGYICDDYTHRWCEDLVLKVTKFKNDIIEYAKQHQYDYLFFIDSDIILHPKTLIQLISDNKEIISNIFWTKWSPDGQSVPQVWLKDSYTLYDAKANKPLTEAEISQKTSEFLNMLKKPGVYKVGGLGACTLISKAALDKGVNFDPIYNISFWGEDRAFCIRAAVLGIQLHVDTHYPAYHIYRNSDLEGLSKYKEECRNRDRDILGNNILDMIVKGIESANSYSYKEDIKKDFVKYFTTYEASKCLQRLKNDRCRVLENKIINRCSVSDCEMDLNNNNTKVEAKVNVAFDGYQNYYSFYYEYTIVCSLEKQGNGNYLISKIIIEKQNNIDKPQVIRKVSDNPKLTLSMVIKNEEKRYLRQTLESCREFIDNAVIIDDGSTDNSVKICKEVLSGIPIKIVENKKSKFDNEINLRKQQWYETIATNPQWILFLDADEVFEDKFKYEVKDMMKDFDVDVYIFRLYDFWNDTHYREDKLWYAHMTYRPFMIRYQKSFPYYFKETPQHCGRMPHNLEHLPSKKSDLRIKHYGWAKEEDRVNKYKRYIELDPDGKYGSILQYKSILDKKPKLVMWNEKERV